MKTIVGVMGPGEKQATQKDLDIAYDIGRHIAGNNWALLCGGMSGVMEKSAKGAQENGGITIGVGSTRDKSDMNEYLDLPLCTAMGPGRNFMNIISSDVLVFISVGSPGTLSELAFAIQMEKPSVVVNASQNLQKLVGEYPENKVYFVQTVEELQDELSRVIR
jgi:uncharacterized protein (TIGR00725 family)